MRTSNNVGMAVFIVEDDAGEYRMIERAIRETLPSPSVGAIAFKHFTDGVDLMEFLLDADSGPRAQANPILVITDLNMPRMNGLELLEAIRTSADWSHLPVVLMTGYVTPEIALRAHRLGVNSIVAKSLDWHRFRADVGALMRYWCEVAELPSGRL